MIKTVQFVRTAAQTYEKNLGASFQKFLASVRKKVDSHCVGSVVADPLPCLQTTTRLNRLQWFFCLLQQTGFSVVGMSQLLHRNLAHSQRMLD